MTGTNPIPDTWQPSLPGLTLEHTQTNALEAAARATLAALDGEELLTPRHTVTAQLVLELARVVGAAVRHGKAAAAGLAAKQLLEAIAALPEPVVNPDNALAELLARMDAADREPQP